MIDESVFKPHEMEIFKIKIYKLVMLSGDGGEEMIALLMILKCLECHRMLTQRLKPQFYKGPEADSFMQFPTGNFV